MRLCASILLARETSGYFGNILRTIGLGEGESPKLNLASLLKGRNATNSLSLRHAQVLLPTEKATLLEAQPYDVPTEEPCRIGEDRAGPTCFDSNEGSKQAEVASQISIRDRKMVNETPKGSNGRIFGTEGLPKGCEPQGNRVPIV